ncbi:hypothetical protein I601_0204 [Nocardioides dokdonensis FR1436]|uniref:Uncharacterized protein n=1 Tax=Nocardioides dokdonensis FR1436 TaxID=1300347 RepID=A0A1A9GEH4_9ACTN|nr:hypothetical protein [Nocardioides dokdonensis]ANH36658.1 hypothetical protein I601_0204 [Nocardioides dokdonensis FR1436]
MKTPWGARRERREQELQAAEAFRSARRLAREDVTVLGEQVAELEVDLEGSQSHESRDFHQQALDAYAEAGAALEAATTLEQVGAMEEVLDRGRYARAAVLALRAGEPLPERRGPCFFNPQHGPAVTTLAWTPPHGTERQVEVCRNDALRLGEGAEPEVRMVRVGDRYVPWYAANDAAIHSWSSVANASTSGWLTSVAKAEAGTRAGVSQAGIGRM